MLDLDLRSGSGVCKKWPDQTWTGPWTVYSQVAGIAGEYQWGLDEGDHQDAWNPYDGLPDHWIHTDRLENVDDDEKVSHHE